MILYQKIKPTPQSILAIRIIQWVFITRSGRNQTLNCLKVSICLKRKRNLWRNRTTTYSFQISSEKYNETKKPLVIQQRAGRGEKGAKQKTQRKTIHKYEYTCKHNKQTINALVNDRNYQSYLKIKKKIKLNLLGRDILKTKPYKRIALNMRTWGLKEEYSTNTNQKKADMAMLIWKDKV